MMTNKSNGEKNSDPWKAMGLVGVIGIEIAIPLLAGVWLGRKADQYFDTTPIFLVIGITLGFTIGIWSVVNLIKNFLKD